MESASDDWVEKFSPLPWIVLGLAFIREFVSLLKPYRYSSTQLWLRSLGAQVAYTHRIPRALGPETISAAGSKWTPQEWLLGLFLHLCANAHAMFFADLVVAALAMTPIVLMILRLRNGGSGIFVTTCATALLSLALTNQLLMRANTIVLGLTALLFLVLTLRDKRVFFAPVIIVVIANLHASAVVLSLLPGVLCLVSFYEDRSFSEHTKRLAIAAGSSIVASLLTPFGFDLWTYTFSLSGGTVRRHFGEWAPFFSHPDSVLFYLVRLSVVIFFAIGIARRRTIKPTLSELALVAVFTCAALYAQRFIVLLEILLCPIVFRGVWTAPDRFRTYVGPAAAGLLLILTGFTGSIFFPWPPTGMIADAAQPGTYISRAWLYPFVAGIPSRENAYCEDQGDCSAFLLAGAHSLLDGRDDPFPARVWADEDAILKPSPDWQKRLYRLRVNVLISRTGLPFDTAVRRSGTWRYLATDGTRTLYVRMFRPARAFRQDFRRVISEHSTACPKPLFRSSQLRSSTCSASRFSSRSCRSMPNTSAQRRLSSACSSQRSRP